MKFIKSVAVLDKSLGRGGDEKFIRTHFRLPRAMRNFRREGEFKRMSARRVLPALKRVVHFKSKISAFQSILM